MSFIVTYRQRRMTSTMLEAVHCWGHCKQQATAHQRLLDSSNDSLAPFKQEAVTAPTCPKLLRDSDYANITCKERQLAEVIAVGFLTLTKLLRARNPLKTERLAWVLLYVKVVVRSHFGVGGQTEIAGACSAHLVSLYRRHVPNSACVRDSLGQRGQPGRLCRLCKSNCQGCTPKANV